MSNTTLKLPEVWKPLPENVQYLQNKSAQISVESEPEYIFTRENFDIEIVIREYERSQFAQRPKYEIRPISPVGKPIYFDNKNDELVTLLFKLLNSDFISTPSQSPTIIRGYNSSDDTVYNFQGLETIHSESVSQYHMEQFRNTPTEQFNTTQDDLKVKIEYTNGIIKLFEGHGIIEQENQINLLNEDDGIYPIPSKEVLLNTIEYYLSENIQPVTHDKNINSTEITYLDESIIPSVLSHNI